MATRALGTKIKIGSNFIAELTSISGLDISAETIDVTNLDHVDGWRRFIGGMKDGGEVSISGYFNSSDTNGQVAMYNNLDSGTEIAYTILFPASLGASWDFNGIVTKFTTGAELEDKVSFEASIKVSGKPNLGLTPSAGLTGLTVTGAGGALSPTFNSGTYFYSYSGLTATSFTVTATGSNQNIQMYVDGNFVQTLTSASPSQSIPMSIGSKKVTILANESGKTQKMYEIVVIKTA